MYKKKNKIKKANVERRDKGRGKVIMYVSYIEFTREVDGI